MSSSSDMVEEIKLIKRVNHLTSFFTSHTQHGLRCIEQCFASARVHQGRDEFMRSKINTVMFSLLARR